MKGVDTAPTIVFITSVGYSGTTLLDMLIGSSPDAMSVGELYLLQRYAAERAKCTCGVAVPDCPFWTSVEHQLKLQFPNEDVRLSRLPLTVLDKQAGTHRMVPGLSDLLLVLGVKALWSHLAPLGPTSRRYRRSSLNTRTVYSAVAKVSGASHIVDSSKYPTPMKSLYLLLSNQLRIIHLVRDVRAVADSLMRRKNIQFQAAVRRWVRFNFNIELMLATVPNDQVLRVRYEDICMNTGSTLAAIGQFIDLDLKRQRQLPRKGSFHNIGGNPMRFQRDDTAIELRDEWKDRLTEKQISGLGPVASSLNRRYGYG